MYNRNKINEWNIKLDLLEKAIKSNEWLNKQLKSGDITTDINVFEVATVKIAGIPTNYDRDFESKMEMTYMQWKAKLHREYKKVGIIHDKNTYMGYILK